MSNRSTAVISLLLVALSVVVGVLLYPVLPDPMPSHWNAAGEVDGYMSKAWGVFLLPLVTAGLTLMLLVIPAIDPLKANIEAFRRSYNVFVVGFVVFMLFVYGLTLAAALGWQFNMSSVLLPVMGVLLIGLGRLIKRAKRNYFIGIRTPWTLNSDQNWDATHALGARMFTAAGVITIIGALLGETGIWVMLAAVLLAALVPIVYSYLLWRREQT